MIIDRKFNDFSYENYRNYNVLCININFYMLKMCWLNVLKCLTHGEGYIFLFFFNVILTVICGKIHYKQQYHISIYNMRKVIFCFLFWII